MVKFQIINSKNFYSVYGNSLINSKAPKYNDEIIKFFEQFELQYSDYEKLLKIANENQVIFFASCFDDESLEMAKSLNILIYKIASSEIDNLPLLKRLGAITDNVIISTGMSKDDEIDIAINVMKDNNLKNIILMHCVSLYPPENKDLNLNRIKSLIERYNLPVGFSDHSKSNTAALIAFSLGAIVFEKHFKLSENHDCVDKDVSLTPEQFKSYIDEIKAAKEMMGNGNINYIEPQIEVAKSAKRGIYAKVDLRKGDIITESNIIVKRPACGIPPLKYYEIIGKRLRKDIKRDMPINYIDLY